MNRPGVSKSFKGVYEPHTPTLGRIVKKRLGALVIPALITAAPKIAKLISTVSGLLNKIGIGGVTDERFFERYFELRNIFVAAKYLVLGSQWHEDALTRNKIRRTQVKDRGDDFIAEFKRLRTWCIEVMNHGNSNLGTDYAQLFPEFKMANQGNIYSANVEVIKAIVEAVPPGQYQPGMLQEAVKGINVPSGTTTTPTTNLVDQATNAFTFVKDAQGKIIQVRDAVTGAIVQPGTPEYDAAINPKPTEAGMGKAGTVVAVVGGLALLTYLGSQMGNGKKQAPVAGLPAKKRKKRRAKK